MLRVPGRGRRDGRWRPGELLDVRRPARPLAGMPASMILTRLPAKLETTCGLCRGRVVWAVTARGRRIPLDPDPDQSGNQAVSRDVHGTVRTRQLGPCETADSHERLMLPHFPTCQRRIAAGAGARGPARLPAPLPDGVVDLTSYRRRRRPGRTIR